jgi:predicted O-methyltransferase YrrM
VETGVANGVSSAFILLALQKNRKGTLWSVSLPAEKDPYIPEGEGVGWVIPSSLRERWKLLVGSSGELLPDLLGRVGPIDLFFHDSDHSYENMLREFETSWPYIRQGGYLFSDDAKDNAAFSVFTRRQGATMTGLRNAALATKNERRIDH